MGAIEKLQEQVKEIVDYRTTFGRTAVERVQNLAGARIPAMRNLIAALKKAGVAKLNAPLQFKFVGYERAAKHERIGQSIAHPKLRTVYRYSIHTKDTQQERAAGQVTGVGQVGPLGQIEVGGTLKDEFPIFFPVFGDDRYAEFFSKEGREKRNEETTKKVVRTMDEIVLEQLRDRGADVSELKGYLREFFLEAARLDRGNDLLWLQRQFENDKITDNGLATAYFDVRQNTSYSNDSAVLVGNAVMELRKRSARGLIGRLRDDLLFLDKQQEVYDPELDREYTRRVYYPSKGTVREGTLRDKLQKDSITFSEALGIVRMVPGIAQAKNRFNRQHAEKYFGEGHRALTPALKSVDVYLEADKEAYHAAKQRKGNANLKLGKNYRFANEADELSRLDNSKTRAANLLTWVGFKDSERTFSGIYTLANQLTLGESHQDDVRFTGVMASSYTNDVDFRDKTGLDLAEIVLRLNDVEEILVESRPAAKRASKKPAKKRTDKGYSSFRQNLERIKREAEHHLVNVDFETTLSKYGQVLAEYKENRGTTKQDLDRLVRFAEAVDLTCGIDLQRLSQRAYLSDQEISDFQEVRAQLKTVEEFKGLRPADVTRLRQLRKKVEEKLGPANSRKFVYSCQKGSLCPSSYCFPDPHDSIKETNIRYISPKQIQGDAKLADSCTSGTGLERDFIDKLKAVKAGTSGRTLTSDRNYRVGNLDLIIKQLEEKPEGVLITDDLRAEVDVAYRKLSCRQGIQGSPYRQYEEYIDPTTIQLAGTGRYYDITVSGNRDEVSRTFSKKQGGIGYLRWDREQGWYQTRISESRLLEMMDKLAQRDPKVKIKIEKVY